MVLTNEDKEKIKRHVRLNIGKFISVLDLSEKLIKQGSNNNRYFSGKPKVFGYVAVYLNEANYTDKKVSPDRSDVEFMFGEEIIEKGVDNQMKFCGESGEDDQMTLF